MAGYWDPVPTARKLIAGGVSDPFGGEWAERNWRNVPGPFYGARTDSLQMGRQDDPLHIAYDDEYGPFAGTEFVYRQPGSAEAVRDFLEASQPAHGGYAMDGDEHWTVDGVRAWWAGRERVRAWALATAHRWATSYDPAYEMHWLDAAQGLRDYVDDIDSGRLETYLRGYLFWLEHRRAPGSAEALPVLGAPTAEPVGGGEPVVLGYLVATPDETSGDGLPKGVLLTSASDCLGERVPEDGCWFGSPEQAREACAMVDVPPAARVTALRAAPADAEVLAREIRAARTHEPVLHALLYEPPPLADGGEALGWEVLGYDCGLLHSWLCNDLYRDAVAELGVEVTSRGLLADRAAAERLAGWANARTDTKPVVWFAAELIEWPEPIESRFVPVTVAVPAAEPVTPWWRRLLEG
ncbi:hypothetical protein ACGFX4_30705 [Kitasatospora sp. NPDC048365]|uniref:hypothetical protein n=1 Tax=Kitasatospora sp. NPDC048365 TaxID=3364050 RepID=UPI003712BEBE